MLRTSKERVNEPSKEKKEKEQELLETRQSALEQYKVR